MPNPFDITDDVLRAMANLKATNDPNYEIIKKWVSIQQVMHSNYAGTSVHLPMDQVRAAQGAAVFLLNLASWMENPEEEIASREKTEERTAGPEIKIPS